MMETDFVIIMKKMNRTLSMVLTATILFSLMASLSSVAAQGEPKPVVVTQNQYQGTIAGNETNEYTFRNSFQFQIRTNQTIDLDLDVDVDEVGDREFGLELNCSEALDLEVQIRATNDELGMTNGSQIQNTYQYQERFVVNLTLDGECGDLQARLRINITDDGEHTWAYYDEDASEFVPVQSTYANGELTADTTHFSTWTVLTIAEEETTIPGYTALGGVLGLGVLGLVFITKRKNH